jgi:hypothetical protein
VPGQVVAARPGVAQFDEVLGESGPGVAPAAVDFADHGAAVGVGAVGGGVRERGENQRAGGGDGDQSQPVSGAPFGVRQGEVSFCAAPFGHGEAAGALKLRA